jgi:ribonuclease HI
MSAAGLHDPPRDHVVPESPTTDKDTEIQYKPPTAEPTPTQDKNVDYLVQTAFEDKFYAQAGEITILFQTLGDHDGTSIAKAIRERDPDTRVQVGLDLDRHTATIRGPPATLQLFLNCWKKQAIFAGATLFPTTGNGNAYPYRFTHRPLIKITLVLGSTFNECRRRVTYDRNSPAAAIGAPAPIIWFKILGKPKKGDKNSKRVTVLLAPYNSNAFEKCLDEGISLPDGNHALCLPYIDRREVSAFLPNGQTHQATFDPNCNFCSSPNESSTRVSCPLYDAALENAIYDAQVDLINHYCKNKKLTSILEPPPALPSNANTHDNVEAKQASGEEKMNVDPSVTTGQKKQVQPTIDQYMKNKGGGLPYPDANRHPRTHMDYTYPPFFLIGELYFTPIPVPGDGDCFWHSVNRLVYNNTSTVKTLKSKVQSWTLSNFALFSLLCSTMMCSTEEVLREISVMGEWVSFTCVTVAALALEISILTLSMDRSLIFFTDLALQHRKIPFSSSIGITLFFHNITDPLSPNSMNFNHYCPIVAHLEFLDWPLQQIYETLQVPSSNPDWHTDLTQTSQLVPTNPPPSTSPRRTPHKQNKERTKKKTPSEVSPPVSLPQALKQQPPKNPKKRTVPAPDPHPLPATIWTPDKNPRTSERGHDTATYPHPDPLGIWIWNTNSIKVPGRFTEILTRCSRAKIDIICLQETCHRHSIPYPTPGYNVEVGNPANVIQPRGIATLIHSSVVYRRRTDLENLFKPLETVVIELPASSGEKTLIVNVYFNPTKSLPPDSLTQMLTHLQLCEGEQVIVGDFNSPGFLFGKQINSKRGSKLDDFLIHTNSFFLASDFDCTFIRGETRSCLDGVFVSTKLTDRILCKQDRMLGPGHIPYVAILDIQSLSFYEQNNSHRKLDAKYINYEIFFNTLRRTIKPQQFQQRNLQPQDIITIVHNISQAVNKAYRPRPARLKSSGWWNLRCKKAADNRNKALRALQKCHRSSPSFIKKRNKARALSKKAKRIFKEEQEKAKAKIIRSASVASSHKTWEVISRLIGNKQSRKGTPTIRLQGHQAQLKANELCKGFEQIQSADDLNNLQVPHLNHPPVKQKTDKPITVQEMNLAMNKLKNSSCPGPDNIPVPVLKRMWHTSKWSSLLLFLVNEMYRKPALFAPFKHAIIHPIPKPHQPDSFRPISLLSQLGKILERILARRLADKLISPYQFGCRPHRNAQDPLLRLQHWAVMNDPVGISVFLDISKAYDRVHPALVIAKLRKVKGMSQQLLGWLEDFLKDRSFQVRLGGVLSDYVAKPLFGLPQGSPLSVPLWHVFFSDVPHTPEDNIYMDDLNLNATGESYEEAEIQAQDKLTDLAKWAQKNGVIFDVRKTKVLAIDPDVEVTLWLDTKSTPLPQVNTYKYLGVQLSCNDGRRLGFSLAKHMDSLRSQYLERKRWLVVLRNSPLWLLRTAYISLIRSKLTYGILLTIIDYSETLDKFQKDALKVISSCHPGTPYHKLLQILQLPDMLSVAKQIATKTRGRLYAFQGPLAHDYERWIVSDEGEHNMDSPFGLIQSCTIFPPEQPLYFEVYRKLTQTQLRALHNTRIPEQTISKRHGTYTSAPRKSITIYCDGGFDRTTHIGSSGYSIYFPADATLEGGNRYANVFSSLQAETTALRDALYSLDTKTNLPPLPLFIFTDSASLIQGFKQWQRLVTHPPIHAEILSLLALITGKTKKTVTIQWLPGHAGIEGNERADTMATGALRSDTIPTPLDVDLQFFSLHAKTHLLVSNTTPTTTPQTKLPPRTIRRLLHAPPNIRRTAIRAITNHYNLAGCYYRSLPAHITGIYKKIRLLSPRIPETYRCRFCNAHPETLEHLVLQCPHPSIQGPRTLLQIRCSWFSEDPNLAHHLTSHPATWGHLTNFLSTLEIQL